MTREVLNLTWFLRLSLSQYNPNPKLQGLYQSLPCKLHHMAKTQAIAKQVFFVPKVAMILKICEKQNSMISVTTIHAKQSYFTSFSPCTLLQRKCVSCKTQHFVFRLTMHFTRGMLRIRIRPNTL